MERYRRSLWSKKRQKLAPYAYDNQWEVGPFWAGNFPASFYVMPCRQLSTRKVNCKCFKGRPCIKAKEKGEQVFSSWSLRDPLEISNCGIYSFCHVTYYISPIPRNFNKTISLEGKAKVFSTMKIPPIIFNIILNHSDLYITYLILIFTLNLFYIRSS